MLVFHDLKLLYLYPSFFVISFFVCCILACSSGHMHLFDLNVVAVWCCWCFIFVLLLSAHMRFTCLHGVYVPLYGYSYIHVHTFKFQDHAHIGRIVNFFSFYLFFLFSGGGGGWCYGIQIPGPCSYWKDC